jgi:hypothetical protein
MINEVHSFVAYASKRCVTSVVFETCVTAMERGLLHVDTINADGWTLGYMFVENSHEDSCTSFNRYVWDRYWALCPDASLFWRIVHDKKVHSLYKRCSMCVMTHMREALCSTPALWADLSLVQPVARTCGFIQGQVDARMRVSCRFAWIAAVAR